MKYCSYIQVMFNYHISKLRLTWFAIDYTGSDYVWSTAPGPIDHRWHKSFVCHRVASRPERFSYLVLITGYRQLRFNHGIWQQTRLRCAGSRFSVHRGRLVTTLSALQPGLRMVYSKLEISSKYGCPAECHGNAMGAHDHGVDWCHCLCLWTDTCLHWKYASMKQYLNSVSK